MNFIVKTTALGPTGTKSSRIKAVNQDDPDVMCVDNMYKEGNSLSPELNHERTARALANMILGDRGFRIYQVAHRNSGYSFRVVCS